MAHPDTIQWKLNIFAEMKDLTCLNCGHNLRDVYCNNCGQPAGTRRFSLKYVFSMDFFLGLISLERGFFFTVKELFTRPGHAIREYVQGKRIKYLHYFNLLIILITLGIIIDGYNSISLADIMGTTESEGLNKFEQFIAAYPKIYTLLSIPLFAAITFLWFKRAKQNFAEHLVLNAYRASADIVMGLAFTGVAIFVNNLEVLRKIYPAMSLGIIIYEIIFYYQYFKPFGYSKTALFTRSLLAALNLTIVVLTAMFIAGRFL